MLHRAVLLDVVVAAVVVGKQQAVVADNLARAATSKEYNGIFETAVVDGIDVVGSDAHAHLLHLFLVILEEHRDPHALSGKGHRRCKHDGKGKKKSFHIALLMLKFGQS